MPPHPPSRPSRALAGVFLLAAGLALLVLPVATLIWPLLMPLPEVPEVASAVVRIASVLVGANMMGAAWMRRRDILGLIRPPR